MKQKLLLCGAAVFAALFLFSGVMLGRQLADQKQSAEAFDNIADAINSMAFADSSLNALRTAIDRYINQLKK